MIINALFSLFFMWFYFPLPEAEFKEFNPVTEPSKTGSN